MGIETNSVSEMLCSVRNNRWWRVRNPVITYLGFEHFSHPTTTKWKNKIQMLFLPIFLLLPYPNVYFILIWVIKFYFNISYLLNRQSPTRKWIFARGSCNLVSLKSGLYDSQEQMRYAPKQNFTAQCVQPGLEHWTCQVKEISYITEVKYWIFFWLIMDLLWSVPYCFQSLFYIIVSISIENIFYINYCDVHAAARFRGNKEGCLSNDWWMFPRNPFRERVFSLRRCLLYHPSRGHIPRSSRLWVSWVRWVGIQGKRKGTSSSAATRIVLPKDARRAVAVDTATAEWVVSCKTEGVWRDSVVLYLSVRL
jgi:hypothetical protein